MGRSGWTDEQKSLFDEDARLFYHFCYPLTILRFAATYRLALDEAMEVAQGEVYHPRIQVSIDIVGRDH